MLAVNLRAGKNHEGNPTYRYLFYARGEYLRYARLYVLFINSA